MPPIYQESQLKGLAPPKEFSVRLVWNLRFLVTSFSALFLLLVGCGAIHRPLPVPSVSFGPAPTPPVLFVFPTPTPTPAGPAITFELVPFDAGDWFAEAQHAGHVWNVALGVQVFKPGGFIVPVTAGERRSSHPRAGGFAARYPRGGAVWFYTGVSLSIRHHVALHELGHVLGLDHSAGADDVMRSSTAHPSSRLSANDIARAKQALGL